LLSQSSCSRPAFDCRRTEAHSRIRYSCRTRCRRTAADDGTPRQHQQLRAQRRQHGQLERPPQLERRHDSSRSARDPAAPAHFQTESNQHRVSCSMVDKMEVQDSAQRITSLTSQQTASTTHDSLRISTRSAMPLCVLSDVRSLAFHQALGRMCLCSSRLPRARYVFLLRGSGCPERGCREGRRQTSMSYVPRF
jgi:hypothetical protein